MTAATTPSTMGGESPSSSSMINIDGQCIHHPIIRMRRRTSSGGWKTLLKSCPLCTVRGTTPPPRRTNTMDRSNRERRSSRGGDRRQHHSTTLRRSSTGNDNVLSAAAAAAAASRATANGENLDGSDRSSSDASYFENDNISPLLSKQKQPSPIVTPSSSSRRSNAAADDNDSSDNLPTMPLMCKEVNNNGIGNSSSSPNITKGLSALSVTDTCDATVASTCSAVTETSSSQSMKSVGGSLGGWRLLVDGALGSLAGTGGPSTTTFSPRSSTNIMSPHQEHRQQQQQMNSSGRNNGFSKSFNGSSSGGGLDGLSSLGNGSSRSSSGRNRNSNLHRASKSLQQNSNLNRSSTSLGGLSNLHGERSRLAGGGDGGGGGGVWRYGDEQQQQRQQQHQAGDEEGYQGSSSRQHRQPQRPLSRRISTSVGGAPSGHGAIWRYGDEKNHSSSGRMSNSSSNHLAESSPARLEHEPCPSPHLPHHPQQRLSPAAPLSRKSSTGSNGSSSSRRRQRSNGHNSSFAYLPTNSNSSSRPPMPRQSSVQSVHSAQTQGSRSSLGSLDGSMRSLISTTKNNNRGDRDHPISYSPNNFSVSNNDNDTNNEAAQHHAVVCGMHYLNPTNSSRGSYTGQVHPTKQGVPHGIGTLRYHDGSLCEGEWIDGVLADGVQTEEELSECDLSRRDSAQSTSSSRRGGTNNSSRPQDAESRRSSRRSGKSKNENLEEYLDGSGRRGDDHLTRKNAEPDGWYQPCGGDGTPAIDRQPPTTPGAHKESHQQMPMCSPCSPAQSTGNSVKFSCESGQGSKDKTTRRGSRKKKAGPYSAQESKVRLPPATSPHPTPPPPPRMDKGRERSKERLPQPPPLVSLHSSRGSSTGEEASGSTKSIPPSFSSHSPSGDNTNNDTHISRGYESLIRARNALERKSPGGGSSQQRKRNGGIGAAGGGLERRIQQPPPPPRRRNARGDVKH